MALGAPGGVEGRAQAPTILAFDLAGDRVDLLEELLAFLEDGLFFGVQSGEGFAGSWRSGAWPGVAYARWWRHQSGRFDLDATGIWLTRCRRFLRGYIRATDPRRHHTR